MTLTALHAFVRARESERALLFMIEYQRVPSLRLMTCRAIGRPVHRKLLLVNLRMTGLAPRLNAFVLDDRLPAPGLHLMAALATDLCVLSEKRKVRLRVIEACLMPLPRRMTGGATLLGHQVAKLPAMLIFMTRFAMDGGKAKHSSPVGALHVALLAWRRRVCARQCKPRSRVGREGER